VAKENESITWAIFVSPLNSQYQFTNINDVVLTQATGSTLTVTSPSAITDGNLVFLVQHIVGNQDSIQTLNVTGNGASLAFTVALLTVNTTDAIALATLSPASQVFNTAGSNQIQFTTGVQNGYYIDPANITIDTSGMPAATNIGSPTTARSGNPPDNVQYTIPVTVPATATAGTISATGTATIKPELTWAQITGLGNLVVPSPHTVGVPYAISPYDASTERLSTITYTCTATEVLLSNAYAITYNASGAVTQAYGDLENQYGRIVFSIQLPMITSNTTATATITGSGAVPAAIGAPSIATIPQAGTDQTIASTWNVNIKVTPGTGSAWIKLNGNAGTVATVNQGATFTLGAETNNTGSARSGTIEIETTNTRIVPALATQTITINQN